MKTKLHEMVPGTCFRTAALTVLLLAAGCSKSDVPEEQPQPGKMTVHASTEATRTLLGDNHSVVWSAADMFRLFTEADITGQPFTLTEGEGTSSGTFTGLRPVGNEFVALYPDRYAEMEGSVPVLTLPASQRYTEGSFASGSNPMIARTTDPENLSFTNLCGVIELQIAGSGNLSSIVLRSDADTPLTGRGRVVERNGESLLTLDAGEEPLRMENIGRTLSEEPASFYLVVPAATYKHLEVTMTDAAGNATVRTAASEIVVSRGHIAPLTGLRMDPPVVEPAVKIEVAESESGLFNTVVSYEMDAARCDSYYMKAVLKHVLDQYLSQDPEHTVNDYLMTQGELLSESGKFNYGTQPRMEIVFLAMPMKNDAAVHDPVRLDYSTPEVPIDPALAVDDLTLTPAEASVDLSARLSGTPNAFLFKTLTVEEWSQSDPFTHYYNLLEYGNVFDSDLNPQFGFTIAAGLLPSTDYVLIYALRSELGYTNMYMAEFRTLDHVNGRATLAITPIDVLDYTASFRFEVSGGSTYKCQLFMGKADGYDPDAVAAEVSKNPVMDSESLRFNVQPQTTYTLFGIAYDDEGVYGELTALTFTTQAPIPGEDTPEYRRFIGEWAMSYDNIIGTAHPALSVTVTEEAAGNTYLVSGLLSRESRENYVMDDTVRARFIDGELVLEGGTPVADAGTLAAKYSVMLYTLFPEGTQLYLSTSRLRGSFADDRITFRGEPSEIIAYLFYATDNSGAGGNLEPVAPSNIVWTRPEKGQTEGFQYDTPWNPGWN